MLVLAVQTVFPDKVNWAGLRSVMRKEYPPHGPLWSYVPLFCVCCALQQSLAKPPAEKSRSKKSKEPKPRVKKLKYHQYIPPDQKQELNDVPMDSAYARLLQQQQQFLQLQILNQQKQQQQQYNYQASKLKYGSIKLYFIAVRIFLILITITSTLIFKSSVRRTHLVM